MNRIEAFENMLAKGQDNHLLRYSLGKEYLSADRPEEAISHLKKCVELAPNYSAAWNSLGKAHQAVGQIEQAEQAWTKGIEAAQANGDKQAEKEMTVFLRRLAKAAKNG